jgi:hypothetical protein
VNLGIEAREPIASEAASSLAERTRVPADSLAANRRFISDRTRAMRDARREVGNNVERHFDLSPKAMITHGCIRETSQNGPTGVDQ